MTISEIARWRMLGREDLAQGLLEAHNRIASVFGGEQWTMPEPADPRLYGEGLVIADAREVRPGEFLRAIESGDWRAPGAELKRTGTGGWL